MRRIGLVAHVGAELERHSEKEYKNPEHDKQRHPALIPDPQLAAIERAQMSHGASTVIITGKVH
jgi:hypothetical protein